jgi:hypothetical protein
MVSHVSRWRAQADGHTWGHFKGNRTSAAALPGSAARFPVKAVFFQRALLVHMSERQALGQTRCPCLTATATRQLLQEDIGLTWNGLHGSEHHERGGGGGTQVAATHPGTCQFLIIPLGSTWIRFLSFSLSLFLYLFFFCDKWKPCLSHCTPSCLPFHPVCCWLCPCPWALSRHLALGLFLRTQFKCAFSILAQGASSLSLGRGIALLAVGEEPVLSSLIHALCWLSEFAVSAPLFFWSHRPWKVWSQETAPCRPGSWPCPSWPRGLVRWMEGIHPSWVVKEKSPWCSKNIVWPSCLWDSTNSLPKAV